MAPIIRTDLPLGESRSSGPKHSLDVLHILVLGGFRGSASTPTAEPGQRRPTPLDRDNLDDVFARLGVEVNLSVCGSSLRLGFLDDFHPDALIERLPHFQHLADLRRRLLNPATFAAAASELGVVSSSESRPAVAAQAQTQGLLDQLLADTAQMTDTTRHSDDSDTLVRRLVRDIVAPHAQAAPHAGTNALVAAVDQSMSELLRRVLHDPEFARLESLWRGVEFLLTQVDSGPHLKVYLLDLSEAEFKQDLDATDELDQTTLFRLLNRDFGPESGMPIGLIVADYRFDGSVDDTLRLAKVAFIADAFESALVAAGDVRMAGCGNPETLADVQDWNDTRSGEEQDSWGAFRALAEASHVALCAPRVLQRRPYGATGSSIEAMAFEEMSVPPKTEDFCWGSGVFQVAAALATGISEEAVDIDSGRLSKFGRMPLHAYKLDGEFEITPPTGFFLPDRSVKRLQQEGFTVIQSVRNEDSIIIDGIRSCSQDSALLKGAW